MRYVATKRALLWNGAAVYQVGLLSGIFGDGSDLDVSVSTAITLTRNVYYKNLKITSTGSINTAGFQIFVSNILSMDAGAKITRNGAVATTSTGATGLLNGVLGGSSTGGNGGATPTAGTGNTNGLGGNGGAGGSGGAGGVNTQISTATGAEYLGSWPLQVRGSTVDGNLHFLGGAGGGGALNGLGGGSGGGIIQLFARGIQASGGSFIEAKGGDGATSGGNGSGGGGGGCVYVITSEKLTNIKWTVNVSGGLGAATGGVNGSVGRYIIITGD